MTTATKLHHTYRGIDYINNVPNKYAALGRTTPWTDDNYPPVESASTTDIDEIIGFIPVSIQKFIIQDSSLGTIIYNQELWRIIEIEEALAVGASHVLLSSYIYGTGLPLTTYRQIGLYVGVTLVPGVQAGIPILPSQVVSNGRLEEYHNDKPLYRSDNKAEYHRFILQF